jgi:integrase
MAKELLTAHKIRSISAPGIFKDGAGLRLIARGSKGGGLTKRWELWISIKGKKCELGLGAYPGVSLSDAREEADKIRRAARAGIDLRQQRLKEKAQACTFREAFDSYFAIKRQQLSNPKHLEQWPRTMETYVFPCFGDVPVADVTSGHVLAALEPIWFEKPETARRVLQRTEAVFKSAIMRGAREKASPCVGVAEELGTRRGEVRHHAALPWDQVPAFIALLQSPTQRGWPTTRLAFEFLILTATRSGETRSRRLDHPQGADEVAPRAPGTALWPLSRNTTRSTGAEP